MRDACHRTSYSFRLANTRTRLIVTDDFEIIDDTHGNPFASPMPHYVMVFRDANDFAMSRFRTWKGWADETTRTGVAAALSDILELR